MRRLRISFSGYLEGLQTEGALAVMEATRIDARPLATQHEGNVAATLNVQWKSIQGEGARLVLQTAALLTHAAVIPRARLSLLTGLSDEPRSWREAPLEEALRELSSLSLLEEFSPKQIKLHRLVRELIEKHIPDRETFAAARALTLLDALWDFKRLEREVIGRGIIEVLADLNIARGLAGLSDAERLTQLIRPLDREAHSLQSWNPERNPGFFLQQLYNQALELGLENIRERAQSALDAAKSPWFQQRFSSSGDSRALVRTLEGHIGGAHGLALSADGRIVVSAGADKTVKMWDWATGKLVRVLQGNTAPIWAIAVTPDGRYAISASLDRTLRIWELATGRLVRTLEGHDDWVTGVAITPDGRSIISSSQDTTLAIWDLHSGDRIAQIAVNAAIYCCALAADGSFVVTGDASGAVRFIDIVGDR